MAKGKKNSYTCEVCGIEPAVHFMYKTWTDDDGRSNGDSERTKIMCSDCADEAEKSGDYEKGSDE